MRSTSPSSIAPFSIGAAALLRVAVGLTAALAAAAPLLAQQGSAPPGFTLYELRGEGVDAPPFALKIEGDSILGVADSTNLLRVVGGSVESSRTRIEFDTAGGPASFLGLREGDAFAGYGLMTTESRRVAMPMLIAPVGSETEVSFDPAALASGPDAARVEVVPRDVSLRAGEKRRFVARVFDASGREVAPERVEWYAMGGNVTPEGEFSSIEAGEQQVVAVVNGAIGTAPVQVAAPRVTAVSVFTEVPKRLAAGSRVPLELDAMTEVGRWNLDPEVELSSSAPEVVAVERNALVARQPGRATVRLVADEVRRTWEIEVVPGGTGPLAIRGVPQGHVRTGEVLHLEVDVPEARPIWAVAEPGAQIYPDGAFVAEEPDTYTVVATLGERVATTSVEVHPRGVSGRIHIVGHGKNPGTFTADIWPTNGYVYLGTHQADQVRTYDVSDPANPVLTDSITVDARVINSVKVSADGKLLLATREGASNRKNGFLIFSLEDPAHPKLISEYTETLTGGVHNVFWVGDVVYCTGDATGDMHIVDLSDPEHPKEIGRWHIPPDGRSLHDVWVQDGIAYLSYWRDGLVILDVGGAGKGGTPEKPVEVSRIFYPAGPTHSAFRYGDYIFVSDEDFSLEGTMPNIPGLDADPRGAFHVIDVSDLEHPRHVARYEVPEAGAHNFWIQDGVLYAGYYQGGIRIVDVSGELRGDLYRQGREIAYFLPAATPEDAKLPYAPMVWGVFPMFGPNWTPEGDVWYAPDYNSGLWSFKVEIEGMEQHGPH